MDGLNLCLFEHDETIFRSGTRDRKKEGLGARNSARGARRRGKAAFEATGAGPVLTRRRSKAQRSREDG